MITAGATITDDNKITKSEATNQDLGILMLRLKDLNHPATLHLMNHISLSLSQNNHVIEDTLQFMTVESLELIRSEVEANINELFLLQSLPKMIFVQDMTDIPNMNLAMKLSEEAIKLITTVKL